MDYVGQVKNGVVVFENGDAPEEGSTVRVEPIEEAEKDDGNSKLSKRLLGVAVKASGLPKDLARNHDHYLRT